MVLTYLDHEFDAEGMVGYVVWSTTNPVVLMSFTVAPVPGSQDPGDDGEKLFLFRRKNCF